MPSLPIPDPTEDFSVDPVELFFDLVFVFAFSRLVYFLVHSPTWQGVGQFSLLFTMIWIVWSTYAWTANAVAGNSRPVRVLLLVATGATVPMAAGVSSAFAAGGLTFAVSLSIILAMGLLTTPITLQKDSAARRSAIEYSIPNWCAIALIILGGALPGGWRTAAWLAGTGCVMVAMMLAGSKEWIMRPGHFAERHGLIVIVALGAPLVAAIENDEVTFALVAMLGVGGALAGLMWWMYFDRVGPAIERRHDEITDTVERGVFGRDVYTFAHFPMVAGILFVAAGVEEIALHPVSSVPDSFRWMLWVGLLLYAVGVAGAVGRSFSAIAYERLIATAFLGAVTLLFGNLDGIWIVVIYVVTILIALIVEYWRVERRYRDEHKHVVG